MKATRAGYETRSPECLSQLPSQHPCTESRPSVPRRPQHGRPWPENKSSHAESPAPARQARAPRFLVGRDKGSEGSRPHVVEKVGSRLTSKFHVSQWLGTHHSFSGRAGPRRRPPGLRAGGGENPMFLATINRAARHRTPSSKPKAGRLNVRVSRRSAPWRFFAR